MMNYPTPAAVLVSSPRPFGHAVRRSSRSRSGWVLALSFPATFAGHALALQVARTWAPFPARGCCAPRAALAGRRLAGLRARRARAALLMCRQCAFRGSLPRCPACPPGPWPPRVVQLVPPAPRWCDCTECASPAQVLTSGAARPFAYCPACGACVPAPGRAAWRSTRDPEPPSVQLQLI